MLQFDYFFLKVKGDICYVFEEYMSQTRKGAVYKNDKTDESKSRGGEERRKVIKKQQLIQFLKDLWNIYTILEHSHKKQKDSLDGSLDRVLFAAELKISKILVLRLPQNSSSVNNECAGIYLYFIILILLSFWLCLL